MQRLQAIWQSGWFGKIILSLGVFALFCCVMGTISPRRAMTQAGEQGRMASPASTETPASSAAFHPTVVPPTVTLPPSATVLPTATPIPEPPIGKVLKAGNVRSEPRIAAETVSGQLCLGDRLAYLSKQRVGDSHWYWIQVVAHGDDCPKGTLTEGQSGWANEILLSLPTYSVEEYARNTGITLPTAIVLPTATPAPTARPAQQFAPSTNGVRVGAICRDGSRSSATGRGACSHHGGVAQWIIR